MNNSNSLNQFNEDKNEMSEEDVDPGSSFLKELEKGLAVLNVSDVLNEFQQMSGEVFPQDDQMSSDDYLRTRAVGLMKARNHNYSPTMDQYLWGKPSDTEARKIKEFAISKNMGTAKYLDKKIAKLQKNHNENGTRVQDKNGNEKAAIEKKKAPTESRLTGPKVHANYNKNSV